MNDLSTYEKLPLSFYQKSDVVQIAQQLLGKYVFTDINGIVTAGKIVETEAYRGRDDRACHAYDKRTKRTETMYQEGGIAYVYLCYGMHHLFNIVTNQMDVADAVLIRALEPVFGVEEMMMRRGKTNLAQLTKGPGILSQALGITTGMDGESLRENLLWIAEQPNDLPFEIDVDRRVGVDYAGEDAKLPWRFMISGSPYISVKKRNL